MFSGSKPTFGTPTNTGFGFGNTNQQQQQQQASPFGNSFARPAATNPGFAQQNTSLFGAQPAATGGLFGAASTAPAFGQTQAAPQTGFSGELLEITEVRKPARVPSLPNPMLTMFAQLDTDSKHSLNDTPLLTIGLGKHVILINILLLYLNVSDISRFPAPSQHIGIWCQYSYAQHYSVWTGGHYSVWCR